MYYSKHTYDHGWLAPEPLIELELRRSIKEHQVIQRYHSLEYVIIIDNEE